MSNEVEEVSTTSNNKGEKYKGTALNRKTKVELIDIIFRKDDTEHKLRDAYNNISKNYDNITEKYNRLYDYYKELNEDYTMLKNDYEDLCDNKIEEICHLNTELKSKDKALWVLCILFVISVILNLILYLY